MWQTVSGHTGIPNTPTNRSAMSAKLFSGVPVFAERESDDTVWLHQDFGSCGHIRTEGWGWKERWRRGREDDSRGRGFSLNNLAIIFFLPLSPLRRSFSSKDNSRDSLLLMLWCNGTIDYGKQRQRSHFFDA